jgi:hypothetical protein
MANAISRKGNKSDFQPSAYTSNFVKCESSSLLESFYFTKQVRNVFLIKRITF